MSKKEGKNETIQTNNVSVNVLLNFISSYSILNKNIVSSQYSIVKMCQLELKYYDKNDLKINVS